MTTFVRDCKYVWILMIRTCRRLPVRIWLGLLLFLIISGAVLLPFEASLFAMVHQYSPVGSKGFAKFLSLTGEFHYLSLTGTALLMALAYLRNDRRLRRLALSFFLASSIAGITVNAVKPIVGRPRPSNCIRNGISPLAINGPTLKYGFYSYPSGHTAVTVAGCSVIAIACPRLIVPCVLFCLGMAWARMIGNNHFPLDTLHGGTVGLFSAYLCTRWLRRRHRHRKLRIFPAGSAVRGAASQQAGRTR